MLLAESMIDAGPLGNWLLGLATVAIIAGAVVSLWNGIKKAAAQKEEKDRFITRGEMEEHQQRLENQLAEAKRTLEENDRTNRKNLHELNNQVHKVGLDLAKVPIDMRAMIDASIVPFIGKVDKMANQVAVLFAIAKLQNKGMDLERLERDGG